MSAINWFCLSFDDLDTRQLHDILKLRVDVFVVEQNCPYPEIDGLDLHEGVRHLLGYQDGQIIAYARLLPNGLKYNMPSIGRVIAHPDYRKDGLGHQIMKMALRHAQEIWPRRDLFLQAQQHLEAFYTKHGFQSCSDTYLEDNIPHVDMIYRRTEV